MRQMTMPVMLALVAGCPRPEPEPEGPSWDGVEVRKGLHLESQGEGFVLVAVDLDGDGVDEVGYGGRGLAIYDGRGLQTGRPKYAPGWPARGALSRDGDNDWVQQAAVADLGADAGPDLLVLDSTDRLHGWDGATGKYTWNVTLEGTLPTFDFAAADWTGDGVTDVYPSGTDSLLDGKDGSVVWTQVNEVGPAFPRVAELDGAAGPDLLLVNEFAAWGPNPPPETTVRARAADGRLLWSAETPSNPIAAIAADVDGDGKDEAVLGLQDEVVAVGPRGELWSAPVAGYPWVVASMQADEDAALEVVVGVEVVDGGYWELLDDDGTSLSVLEGDYQAVAAVQVPGGVVVGQGGPGAVAAGEVRLLKVQDGALREVWSTPTGLLPSAMAVSEGPEGPVLVVGNGAGELRRLDLFDGSEAPGLHNAGFGTRGATGDLNGDGAYDLVQVDVLGNIVATNLKTGDRLWSARLPVGTYGAGTGLYVGDVDADGDTDVIASGTSYETGEGFVVRLTASGERVWSSRAPGFFHDLRIARLDDDTRGVVVAFGPDPWCGVRAFGLDGEVLWKREIDGCFGAYLAVADVDHDGVDEIAYADDKDQGPWTVAVVNGDGSVRWSVENIDRTSQWVDLRDDQFVHGGYHADPEGHVTARDARTGEVQWAWRPKAGVDPELETPMASGVVSGRIVEDVDGDRTPEVLVSTWTGETALVSGKTGTARWVVRTEPDDTAWADRHTGSALFEVPGTEDHPRYFVVADRGGRLRSSVHVFDEAGKVRGSVARDGWGIDVTHAEAGPIVIGGLDVVQIEVGPR
jgi:hypothetical protein